MCVGDRPAVRTRTVADALEKVDAGHRRKPLQFVDREHQRPINKAVEHEFVLGRVDVGEAIEMLRREVQRCQRDDADRLAERSARARPVGARSGRHPVGVARSLDRADSRHEPGATAVEDGLGGIQIICTRPGVLSTRSGCRGAQSRGRGGSQTGRRDALPQKSPSAQRLRLHLPSCWRSRNDRTPGSRYRVVRVASPESAFALKNPD